MQLEDRQHQEEDLLLGIRIFAVNQSYQGRAKDAQYCSPPISYGIKLGALCLQTTQQQVPKSPHLHPKLALPCGEE